MLMFCLTRTVFQDIMVRMVFCVRPHGSHKKPCVSGDKDLK